MFANQLRRVSLQNRMFSARMFSSNPKVFFDIERDNSPIGRIEFEVYADKVPKTAENFRSLCAGDNKEGYTYKASHFHRIITGFMAQGGDFTNHNGTGGKSIYGNKFPDEASGMALQHTKRGQLSMANAGPNTNGSQFFICFTATPWLNGKHAVFGHMTDGAEVLDALEAAGSNSGKPAGNFVIADCGEIKAEPEA